MIIDTDDYILGWLISITINAWVVVCVIKPVTRLVAVDQLIDLQLTSNSTLFHEFMKILYENVDAYW